MRPPLLLASTSRYRAELLARLRIPFAVEAPHVDESPRPGELAPARALRLAREKASAVASRHPDAWVIGSDQVADREGKLLEKPGNADRARSQLEASSGRCVEFHTAVVLSRAGTASALQHVDLTRVRFRQLTPVQIARYVELDRPFDCAGGFRSEGLGVRLFESIETQDPAALVGLPLVWLAGALGSAGYDPLVAPQS